MIGLWLHEMGARVVAFPFRIVIGLVFINIGLQSMGAYGDVSVGQAPLLDLSSYGFDSDSWGPTGIGLLLVIAGALSMVGMFVRIVGGVLFFVVVSNLFAGIGGMQGDANMVSWIQLLQNRLLLAVCSMILFFLGSGMFSLDGIIFRTLGGMGDGDDGGKKKGGH